VPDPSPVFEHLPVPIYVFRDVAGEFVLVAANFRARSQNPVLGSLVGRPMAHLYADQPHANEDARRCMRDGVPVTRETVLRRLDRLEANQRVRLVFTRVEPDFLVISAETIAEPTLTAAALRESEERYRSLVASLPDAVILRGAEGRVIACNDVAAAMCGRAGMGDLLGRLDILADGYVISTLAGEPVAPEAFPSRRVLETGEPELGRSFLLKRPDGSTRFFRVSAQAMRAPDGTVAGSVTVYADDTERWEAQRAAAESTARLSMALDAGSIGTWSWEPSSDRGQWSAGMNERFHLPAMEQGIQAFVSHIHPDDRARLQALAATATNGRDGDVFDEEWRVVGSDGVMRWARTRGRLERRDGTFRMAGTILDITERRALEEELRRAHRLESIGRLAGGLAHDFNNLLAAMIGSVDLLQDVVPPSGREDLDTMRHGAERARELTAQLLAFARKTPVALTVFDLGALVGKVERLLRRLVGPQIELSFSLADGAWVHADAAQLEQVIVNLVANARDAMPNGGPVSVVLSVMPERVVLEVADHGSGMDENTRAHAFDPFFTTKTTGTGLGLASCYGIVQQHGGDIDVESEPGSGTRFRVQLPRATAPVPEAAKAIEKSEASVGTILVIDDDAVVRRTAVRLLRSLGYDVLVASGGEEAVALVSAYEGPIDAVLCDVAMPARSGLEVATDLRHIRPALRVLFVSGYSDTDLGPPTAGTAFLAKPYTRTDLAARLRQLIER